tara:strand:- start:789 stop:1160 length:372 start_codon:yes stop_codon:yes gene_type:complete
MTYKLVTPEQLEDFRDKECYVDMKMYLGNVDMFAPNVMQSYLPSALLFYKNGEGKVVCEAKSVGNENVTLEELTSRDGDFLAYFAPVQVIYDARNEPRRDPNPGYRFCKIERELPDEHFSDWG